MAVSLQTPMDVANEFATFAFIVKQFLNRVATATLVTVKACTNSGGLSPYGFVDVIPLVSQVNPVDGTTTPHGTVYRLPYFRIQGGVSAAIIDPEPNDIGLAIFAMRDISAVKTNPAQAVANANADKGTPPGSFRQMDMADGLYVGGFLNGVPTQYVQFLQAGAGIKLVSPTNVTIQAPEVDVNATTKVVVTSPEIDLTASTVVNIQAPTINLKGAVAQTAGNVTMAQQLTVTGATALNGGLAVTGGTGATVTGTVAVTGSVSATVDVTANGKSLHNHTHPPGSYTAGATAVTGNSAPP